MPEQPSPLSVREGTKASTSNTSGKAVITLLRFRRTKSSAAMQLELHLEVNP